MAYHCTALHILLLSIAHSYLGVASNSNKLVQTGFGLLISFLKLQLTLQLERSCNKTLSFLDDQATQNLPNTEWLSTSHSRIENLACLDTTAPNSLLAEKKNQSNAKQNEGTPDSEPVPMSFYRKLFYVCNAFHLFFRLRQNISQKVSYLPKEDCLVCLVSPAMFPEALYF